MYVYIYIFIQIEFSSVIDGRRRRNRVSGPLLSQPPSHRVEWPRVFKVWSAFRYIFIRNTKYLPILYAYSRARIESISAQRGEPSLETGTASREQRGEVNDTFIAMYA